MTYIAALTAYWFLYLVLFMGPSALLMLLLSRFVPQLNALWVLAVVFIYFYAQWRAHLAAVLLARGTTTFWEAHLASGTDIRVRLSFLPVIGRFFGGEE